MGSLTSRKAYAAEPAQGRQNDWPVFVCRQGAFLFDPRAHFPVDPEEAKTVYSTVQAAPERGYIVLPACRDNDELLDQPPLGLRLSQADAEKLIQDTTASPGVLAATDIGPALDKASNQDFALAATIKLPHGDAVYQFAAVADGVTSRTLWPERSARLAALAAWRAARRHLELGRGFSHDDFEKFRQSLVTTIRDALEGDMTVLSAPDHAKVVPAGWAPETYEQFKSRRDLWYNSTLLVVLVGPEAGFVMTCGDGGLVVRKRVGDETKSTVLVQSTDDLSVTGVVSLAPDALQFRQTRIALPENCSIEIVMATDGVDRTLRRALGAQNSDQDPYGPDFTRTSSAGSLNALMLHRLDQIENRDIDNVSAAVLRWPSPPPPVRATPAYQGTVAGTGQTVDDINRKLERIKNDGAARLRAAVTLPITPTISTGWQPPPVGSLRLPPVRNLPDVIGSSPSQSAQRSPLGIAIDLTVALARACYQGSASARAVLLERLCKSDRMKDRFAVTDRVLPNLTKLAFFVLAETFNNRSIEDRFIETTVDHMILGRCRFSPTLTRQEIDVSISSAFTMLLRELVRSEPLLRVSVRNTITSIKSL